MMLGTKIPGMKKLTNTKKIGIYHKPKYVYIPLISQNDTNITVIAKKGDYVYKGSVIGKRKGNLRIPIHSSVSGTVVGFEERPYLNGSVVKCVKIENDFKEKEEVKKEPHKTLNHYTKKQFINLIKECGIVGLGGAGFPTYVKYDTDKPIKTLLINAVECEPYITADYALMMEKCEEILETIDAILEICHIEEGIIAVKKNNTSLIKLINSFIGTYLKIKLVEVPNQYPMGWERNLIKQVKHVTYQSLPIEKGIVVNNVSTIYAIYEALKYERPLTERVVTFTGEMLKEPKNVLVKLGTPAHEVIESLGGYKRNKNIRFVAGGPMMGVAEPNDDLIVTSNLNCVLVLKEGKESLPSECLRCGKCVSVCPAKLSPVLIKDYLKKPERLKELEPNRCIECGLCTYICPSKILVREFVKEAKKKSREG